MTRGLKTQVRAAKSAWLHEGQGHAPRSSGRTLGRLALREVRLQKAVRDGMPGRHGLCTSGFLILPADSARALARNSCAQRTFALWNRITGIAPAGFGKRLTALAYDTSRGHQSDTSNATVSDAAETTIAPLKGLSRTVKGRQFPEPPGKQR